MISFSDSLRLFMVKRIWYTLIRDELMSKKPESKNEALEALDFIVNVLKEHERDLDRLINDLGTVTDQLGETGELNGKVEKVEEKINVLQNEVSSLLGYLSKSQMAPVIQKEAQPVMVKEQKIQNATPMPAPMPAATYRIGPPVILQCKQWEDFQNLAAQAQTLSFAYKEAEKLFEVTALKGNQIITYSGEIPKVPSLLRMWLSKQLDVSETKVLEGILTIG